MRHRMVALAAVLATAAGLLTAIVANSSRVVSVVGVSNTQAAPRILHWKPIPYRHLRVRLIRKRRSGGPTDSRRAWHRGAYARARDPRDHGPLGAYLPKTSTAHAAEGRGQLAAAGPAVAGNGSNNRVLILDSTVTGGTDSIEAQEAAADGYGVDIVDAATWSAMTADQFAAYRAIVLGDPTCSDESSVAAAEANATTWGPVIDGNIEIIGSDPVFHATNTDPAIAAVTQRAVDFATAQSGKTGAYISLSCYFDSVAPQTHVSLLDGLDPSGSGFSVQGVGCSDSVHIEATSPALNGIDDALLSNWECSVHEAFDSWPARFGVLAVDTDAGSLYTGQDGTTGDPYILAYPGGSFQGSTEEAGGGSLTSHDNHCTATRNPVDCATGEFWHTFDDLTVPGRGPALDLARTYNSLRAGTDSPFGFGWNSTYTMSLAVDSASGAVQVTQENGSTTVFTPTSGGYAAPPRVYATLTNNPDGTWTFIRHQRQRFVFDSGGRLTAISDLNGYTTILGYNDSGQLSTVSDPEGRDLAVTYGANGKISTVTDPAGRAVSYGYDSNGNLTNVTDVAGGAWAFGYDANHLMTSMTDPRGGGVSNAYDTTGRVTSQTDAAGRTTAFAYSAAGTAITDPNGNVTDQQYTQGQLVQLTKGVGTSSEASWTYTYDPATLGVATQTDPNGNVTSYSYANGSYNPTSVTDALGHTTTTAYNDFEEPLTVTDPAGVTTTYTYDATGNLTSVSRPLTSTGSAQTTTYTYGDTVHPGDLTSSTDPDGNTSQFSYDAFGDLTATTNPLGDTTTYTYDTAGRRTSMTSPRGNSSGADPAKFTTTYRYDAFGDLIKQTDPLGHVTSYTYDANRDRTATTDANSHLTSYTYDADSELTSETRADGTTIAYNYDQDGNQTSRTDAAGHTTAYAYDPLNRLVSVTDPLGRTTSYSYDGAGNRTSLTDPAGRTTSYGYDAANQLTSITYSDGATPNVTYSYDDNGRRTAMTDGTGTTSYSYDSLNRLTAVTDGAGQTTSYGYDLAGNLTALTYPNGKTVTRGFDKAGQLTSVTDWLAQTTGFSYDADGNLTAEAYPNGVTASSSYDNAGQLTSIADRTSAATLASFTYTRDNLGQITAATPAGVPDVAHSYTYTKLNQLGSDNTGAYGYDLAGNLTRQANGATQTYDAASELTSATLPVTPKAPVRDQLVSANETTRASKIVSPAFSTRSRNELILAFISADGPSKSAQKIASVSGGGLRWSLAARSNRQPGSAEVWQAHASSRLASVKITAVLYNRHYDGSITVATFTGASTTVGAHAAASARTGRPAVSLTTTKTSSLVWADGTDWDHAKARTPARGQTLVHQFLDTKAGDTYWVQRTGAIPAAHTTVKVSDTAPTTDRWDFAAVEITSSGRTSTQISYGYDSQGNRTSITPSGRAITVLSYDQADRLTAYGTTATYTYNGDGLRMTKTVSATTTTFAYDQSGTLPLLLTDGAANYVYGPGGQPIEKISGTTVTYLHADQQGSTRLLTDTTGSIVGTYTYNAYGKTVSHTGSASTPLQYDGQYTDAETGGFLYMRARYYDPTTGQFVTVDPAQALTAAPYIYAANDPLNRLDPSGLSWWNPFSWNKDTWETVSTVAAVTGVIAGGVLLCVATACAGDVAALAGATTLEESLALAETAGNVASAVGYGAWALGTTADFGVAAHDCPGALGSAECTADIVGLGIDAAVRYGRSFISDYSIWGAIYDTATSGGTLLYGEFKHRFSAPRPVC